MRSQKFFHTKGQINGKALAVFLVVFSAVFLWIGLLARWTASEVYPSVTIRHLFSEQGAYYLFSIKPLYNLFLFVSFHVSEILDIYPVTLNRILFTFNGIALSVLLYKAVRKKSDFYNGALAVLILVSSHIFLTRGFRIRSDLLLSSMGFLALLSAQKFSEDGAKRRFIAPLLFCMPLVSPKGLYWLIFTGLLLKDTLNRFNLKIPVPTEGKSRNFSNKISIKRAKQRIFSLKSSVVLFVAGAGMSFVFQDPFFLKAAKSALIFYMDNLRGVFDDIRKIGWLSPWKNMSHFFVFATNNFQIVLIILLKTGFTCYETIFSKRRSWTFTDTSFICCLLFFVFHPSQKLFFLCALTPYFLFYFFTDPFYLRQRDKLYSSRFRRRFLIFLLCYGSVTLLLTGRLAYKRNNNLQQRTAVRTAENFFRALPDLRIYDPHGFLIHPGGRHWFLGPYESHKLRLKKSITESRIDVIFDRSDDKLRQAIEDLKEEVGLVNVQNHIYYRSAQIPLTGKENARFSGKFLLRVFKEKQRAEFSKKGKARTADFLSDSVAVEDPDFSQKQKTRPAGQRSAPIEEIRWYMFLDRNRRPLFPGAPYTYCFSPADSPTLKPRCAYREQDFKGGAVKPPKGARFLAVFSIPPPPSELSKKFSFRGLFHYDIFF